MRDDDGFHDAFAAFMRGGGPGALIRFMVDPSMTKRLAVYRNGFMMGAVDALAVRYPAVRAALGQAAFGEVAVDFLAVQPPHARNLAAYGDTFKTFVAERTGAPRYGRLAELDCAWMAAHVASDGPALAPTDLVGVESSALEALAPGLTADVELRRAPVDLYACWSALRTAEPGKDPPAVTDNGPETPLVFHRLDGTVRHRKTGAGEFAFLRSLADGATLAEAGAAGADAEAGFDLATTFGRALADHLLNALPGPE